MWIAWKVSPFKHFSPWVLHQRQMLGLLPIPYYLTSLWTYSSSMGHQMDSRLGYRLRREPPSVKIIKQMDRLTKSLIRLELYWWEFTVFYLLLCFLDAWTFLPERLNLRPLGHSNHFDSLSLQHLSFSLQIDSLDFQIPLSLSISGLCNLWITFGLPELLLHRFNPLRQVHLGLLINPTFWLYLRYQAFTVVIHRYLKEEHLPFPHQIVVASFYPSLQNQAFPQDPLAYFPILIDSNFAKPQTL